MKEDTIDQIDLQLIRISLSHLSDSPTLHLGGAGSSCADVTSPEHLLVAQDTTAGILLIIQELLEGAESVLRV